VDPWGMKNMENITQNFSALDINGYQQHNT